MIRRFLCFSDLHRDVTAARRLVELANEVDFVVGAGDFANRHEGLADTLDVLAEIEKPTILVPGNGETFLELQTATANWKSSTVLHGSGTEIEGISFWGVGGGIPVTPFGAWSYDFDEEQAAELLAGCPPQAILVVHSPPIDTVDQDSSGRVRGSTAIRDCVVRQQPRLVVCGHIHSDWGKQMELGPTRILNAGPRGGVIDLEF
ncbi:MAG: metallophosphoesterase [Pirellulaceae bacterium]